MRPCSQGEAAFTERARVVVVTAPCKRKSPAGAVQGAQPDPTAGMSGPGRARPGRLKIGGGGGNRTRVRKMIPRESYRRVRPFRSRAPPLRPAGSLTRQLDWISSSAHERGLWTSLRLSDARIRPPQAGSGRPSLLIKQREPSARWQMNVPVFLTRPRVPGLHSLVHVPRRAQYAPGVDNGLGAVRIACQKQDKTKPLRQGPQPQADGIPRRQAASTSSAALGPRLCL